MYGLVDVEIVKEIAKLMDTNPSKVDDIEATPNFLTRLVDNLRPPTTSRAEAKAGQRPAVTAKS